MLVKMTNSMENETEVMNRTKIIDLIPPNSPDEDANRRARLFDRFARFYDGDYRDYEDDLPLLTDLAATYGDPILELGCGTGRVLLALGMAGYSIHGVDLSQALLSVAQAKIEAASLKHKICLYRGDIRDFDLSQKDYAFAFATSNTLMHCRSQSEQIMCLKTAYRHMRSDGILLIDLFNPDVVALSAISGLCELADMWHDDQENQVIKWSIRSVDIGRQQQETTFIYEEIDAAGRSTRTTCSFSLRFIWPSEAKLMLEQAGFELLKIWGSFEGGAYDDQSERLILLAQKREPRA